MKFGKKRSGPDPEPIDITERLSILDLRASVRAGNAPTVAELLSAPDPVAPTALAEDPVTAPQPVVAAPGPAQVDTVEALTHERPTPEHHDLTTSELPPFEPRTGGGEPEHEPRTHAEPAAADPAAGAEAEIAVPSARADDERLDTRSAAPDVDLTEPAPSVPEQVVDLTEPVHAAVVQHLAAQAAQDRSANEDDGVIRWTW